VPTYLCVTTDPERGKPEIRVCPNGITITLDTYSHLLPNGEKGAVDRLDNMGSQSGTGSRTGSGVPVAR